MRIRTDNDVEANSRTSILRTTLSSSVPVEVWAVDYVANASYKTTEDVVVPNFVRRSKAGEVFNNPYKCTKSTVVRTPATYVTVGARAPTSVVLQQNGKPVTYYPTQHWDAGTTYGESWFTSMTLTPSGIDEQRLIDLASNAAWASVGPKEASALVSLAELKKTVAYVKSTIFQVTKIMKAIKRLDLKVLRKEVEFSAIADTYMGLRYGLRPLIIDAEQAVKAYNASRNSGERFTSRGKASSSASHRDVKDDSVKNYATTPFSNVGYDLNRITTCNSSYNTEVRAYVYYELTPISLPDLQVWGFHDITGLAWELTPFSFIAGWFMNIADTLAAWQPKVGINVLSSGYTITRSTVNQYERSDSIPKITGYGTAENYVEYVQHFGHTGGKKLVISEEKVRSPGDFRSTPSIDINLDVFKLVDMALIFRAISSK